MTRTLKERKTTEFAGLILLVDAAVLVVAGYPLYSNYGPVMLQSFIAGFIVTSAAFITALYLIETNYEKSMHAFMSVVMGGMLGKMLFLSGAILFIFIFSFLHQIGFTIAVLISYLYKSVMEIIFINKISSESRSSSVNDTNL